LKYFFTSKLSTSPNKQITSLIKPYKEPNKQSEAFKAKQ